MSGAEGVDALIVDSGPSGAVTARRLAAAVMTVLCLEQGTRPGYSKARAGFPDFE